MRPYFEQFGHGALLRYVILGVLALLLIAFVVRSAAT